MNHAYVVDLYRKPPTSGEGPVSSLVIKAESVWDALAKADKDEHRWARYVVAGRKT